MHRVLSAICLLSASTALAAEYFVAPGGDDSNAGTAAQPFRTVDRGLAALGDGDVLTILGGTYRLMEGDDGASGFTADDATIQGAPGETVTLLGSLSTEGRAWEDRGGGLWRTPADFLVSDPAGMHEGAQRIRHVMEMRDGRRAHAPVSALVEENRWTKADDAGAGCDGGNTGCFIYARLPSGTDPNTRGYELSQRKLLYGIGAQRLVIRNLRIFYTQDSAFSLEGARDELIEDNVVGHNSNSDDNAYSLFVTYGGGTVVRRNVVYDSEYWGGFPNSKGITFMVMDENDPATVEDNEVYGMIGQCITTKSGVANLIVRRNYVHDCAVGADPPGSRCDWMGCDPAMGGYEYPGGGWQISENLFENNGTAVSMPGQTPANVIHNNVFRGNDAAIDHRMAAAGTVIANNIFVDNQRGVYLNHGEAGNAATVADFLPTFTSHHNLFHQNAHDYFLRPDWTGPGGSGEGSTLAEHLAAHPGEESGSLSGDPLFVGPDDLHLQPGSPAKQSGDGSFYGAATVDMGMYPSGSETGEADGGHFAGGAEDGGTGTDPGVSEPGCGCTSGTGTNLLGLVMLMAALRLRGTASCSRTEPAPERRGRG